MSDNIERCYHQWIVDNIHPRHHEWYCTIRAFKVAVRNMGDDLIQLMETLRIMREHAMNYLQRNSMTSMTCLVEFRLLQAKVDVCNMAIQNAGGVVPAVPSLPANVTLMSPSVPPPPYPPPRT